MQLDFLLDQELKSKKQQSRHHTKAGHACLSLNKMIRCTFIGLWLSLNKRKQEEFHSDAHTHSMHEVSGAAQNAHNGLDRSSQQGRGSNGSNILKREGRKLTRANSTSLIFGL